MAFEISALFRYLGHFVLLGQSFGGMEGGRGEFHSAFQGELEIVVLKETVWCCVPGAVHTALPCESSNECYFYKDQ